MATGQTTTTQIDPAVDAWYDRVLLKRALPYLVHGLFGQKRPLPSKSGDTIKFRKYTALPKATTPLTEGVTPTAEQLAKTDSTAIPKQYGQYVEIADKITMVVEDQVLNETSVLLGESAGQTIDTIYRDILNAGTSVWRAGAVATRAEIVTKVTATDLDKMLRALRNNKAKYYNKNIKASDGVSTQAIRASYYAIVHPNMIYDLEGITGFVSVANYPKPETAHEMEIGSYKNLRFIETTEGKVFLDEGGAVGSTGLATDDDTNIDVYTMLVFGRDAYGVVDLKGHAMQNIIKPLGSGDDPLNQRATSGWKAFTTCKILQDAFMYRLEAGVTA